MWIVVYILANRAWRWRRVLVLIALGDLVWSRNSWWDVLIRRLLLMLQWWVLGLVLWRRLVCVVGHVMVRELW